MPGVVFHASLEDRRRLIFTAAFADHGRMVHIVMSSALLMAIAAAGGGNGPQAPSQSETIPAPVDVMGPPADATKTSSGLASKVIKAGTGIVHPGPTSSVTVHYSGWTTDGTMFDSSVVRNQPATFPLNRVIAGWTEGVQLMVVGETRRLWIPGALAYDNSPRPGAPQGMLVFDVELLAIN
jgi:hypothetical protein